MISINSVSVPKNVSGHLARVRITTVNRTRPLRSISGSLLVLGPSIRSRILLLGLLACTSLRSRLQRLLRLHMRLHLIQGIALSLSNAVHREQMYLQILLRLKLLVAHVTRDVLCLHGMDVDDVLLQVGIVRVYLAALGALGFTVVIGVIQLMLLIPSLSLLLKNAFDLILRARLQHQIQLIAFGGAALLKTLEVVLQFLMYHQLLTIQGAEGIESVWLRRLLAGGVMMMVLMMVLEEAREILPFRVVTSALVCSRPRLVSRRGCARQPTGTRA